MILALHGRDGTPESLAPLLDAWVAAGYVVVAPTLPETKKDERGKALRSEVLLQAADARYVLDEVLDRAADFGIDPDEVGAAGHVARRPHRLRADLAHLLRRRAHPRRRW